MLVEKRLGRVSDGARRNPLVMDVDRFLGGEERIAQRRRRGDPAHPKTGRDRFRKGSQVDDLGVEGAQGRERLTVVA